MRFEHCYAQPLCTPSRVKIMTGMSNIRNYRKFGVLERDQTPTHPGQGRAEPAGSNGRAKKRFPGILERFLISQERNRETS